MRQEKEGVTEALLENAKKEFLKYGFYDASLRRISADSGVSTNSIYTRFKDKAGLFSAIVCDAADEMMEIYLKSIQAATHCEDFNAVTGEGNQGVDLVLDYVYGHLDEFYLIFCCSQGTEYEDYFDRLAEIEEQYYKQFASMYAVDKKVDDFFIHVFCRMGWQYIYELVTHRIDYEAAKKFMDNVRVFHNAGWKAIIEE